MNKRDRILGGIWGLLVGDAVGVPYEFHSAEELKRLEDIDIMPPQNFHRSHSGVKPGTWSDDGAQALCLLDSLLEKGEFDLEDFAAKLLKWHKEGLFAIDNDVFDRGIQTTMALNLKFRLIA